MTLLAVFVVILFAAKMVEVEESFRDERIAKRKRDERIAKMKCRRSESQMTGLQAHRLKLEMMRHNASAPDGEKQSCPAWLESFPDSNSPVVGCDCFVCKPPKKKFGLTPWELEIVAAVVAGYPKKGVAKYLGIGESQVNYHLRNIFDKLGVSTRLELGLFAINNKMLDSASPRDFAHLGLSLLILARTERMARDGVDQKKKLTDKAQTLLAQSRSLGGR